MNTITSDSSSEEIWAAFEATERPPKPNPREVLWQYRLDEADMKLRHAEDLYKNALANGLPNHITDHLFRETTYAKRAVSDLHAERLRRENNG